jgi:C4-dicarboxylate-specific signal transduction histidine kinase
LAVAATWFQYAFKTVAYAAINGYWAETITAEKARADYENQQFRTLSARQEKLIADLGRLNKAATAGVLTASIAHELNQPLQSAVLNHDMLEQEFAAPQPDRQAVAELLKEQTQNLHRMAAIVQTMRGVFSESGAKPQVLALHKLVEDLSPLIAPQARKHGIEIRYQHEPDSQVSVKASEVQQVILNLLGNAFDALIERHVAQPLVQVSVKQEGEQVVCTVEDNGPGIDEAHYDEVFKILKTTKSAGMGLGLWLARYITERNHGSIAVDRSPLGGARLSVYFPKA